MSSLPAVEEEGMSLRRYHRALEFSGSRLQCLPEDRQWPAKCDNCKRIGESCAPPKLASQAKAEKMQQRLPASICVQQTAPLGTDCNIPVLQQRQRPLAAKLERVLDHNGQCGLAARPHALPDSSSLHGTLAFDPVDHQDLNGRRHKA